MNGFLEILPGVPDHNFDGLDDRFQRAHFPLFTAPEAGPSADPDADGASNQGEFMAGTNPRSAASVIRLKQIEHTATATRVRWQSVAGRRYQAYSRDQFAGAVWQPMGSVVRAEGAVAELTDVAHQLERYYRIEALAEP